MDLVSTKAMTQKIQFPRSYIPALLHSVELHFFKAKVQGRKVKMAHDASRQPRALERNENKEVFPHTKDLTEQG